MTMQQLQNYVSSKTLSSTAFKTKVENIAKVQHLFDTRENWEKDPLYSLVLEKGQIAFVNDTGLEEVMMKAGNGIDPFYQLPYVRFPANDPAEIMVNTKAGWAEQPGFKPAKGQIVIWSDKAQIHKYVVEGDELADEGLIDVPGIKIGDGNAFNLDLPYVGDDIEQKIDQHIKDVQAHVSEQDRKSWNHKITIGNLDTPSDDGVEGETLIIKRN